MIVVDTNTSAYLYLPATATSSVEKLLAQDSQWAAPKLWRSELRNVLALYLRKDVIEFETAYHIQQEAEALMAGAEFEIDSFAVLDLAQRSGCSAYDCEFIALARHLRTKLITYDRKLQKAFPDIALAANTYVTGV